MKRLDFLTPYQDGDFGECTLLFDVGDFEKVADIIQPRKRRRLSEKHKAKLVAAGTKALKEHHSKRQKIESKTHANSFPVSQHP